ncbi:unnamed protein product [Ilex paraguariensis]|uniref:BHLH domain-containing protein n=1 Tax=Ilex paraguariensis TaxID=185542 RepID=A0ABC8UNV5_9AQUA
MQPAGKSSSGLERKEVEKYRRMHMKAHVSRLASLIPTQEKLALPALLDQVTSYVKQLKDRLEELRKRREQLQGEEAVTEGQRVALMVPVVAIKETCSVLEDLLFHLFTGLSSLSVSLAMLFPL